MTRDIAACCGAYSRDNKCPLRDRCLRAKVGDIAVSNEDHVQQWIDTKFEGNKCEFFLSLAVKGRYPREYLEKIKTVLNKVKDNEAFLGLIGDLLFANMAFKAYVEDKFDKDMKSRPRNVIAGFQPIADIGHGIAEYLHEAQPF